MGINIHDVDDSILVNAVERFDNVAEKVGENRKLIQESLGFLAEPEYRRDAYINRQRELSKGILFQDPAINIDGLVLPRELDDEFERKIGSINNILSIEFLEAGLLAARSVGRFTNDLDYGTGFHVGNGILLTNNHVIKSLKHAKEWRFELNIEDNQFGLPKSQYTYSLAPDKFFLTSEELDFTFVAISDSEGNPPIDSFGWHVLLEVKGKILIGQPVNIIQHADGNNKSIVVHDSCLLYLDDENIDMEKYCLYSSDTEEGSSGAPVFNSRWEVVALHHKGIPKRNKNGDFVNEHGVPISDKRDKVYVANEGIRVSKIVEALKDWKFEYEGIAHQQQAIIRDKLINLWGQPGAHQWGLKSGAL